MYDHLFKQKYDDFKKRQTDLESFEGIYDALLPKRFIRNEFRPRR